ncbi:hypothetical protein EOM60_04780 [Candidatus Saccharibacteria bacterium]|nr:hypothetical protein [Candidatus Saccharibacteria bacterium]
MHDIQQQLLDLANTKDLSRVSLRNTAELLGRPTMSPSVLQHHLHQLEKKGLLYVDRKSKTQQLGANLADKRFHVIPIVGMASCGPANQFADEAVEGYLHVSRNSIRKKGDLFAVRATGNSMNNADIATPNGGRAGLDEGDYAIVDTSYTSVSDNLGKYIVSIINGMANIKKLAKRSYDFALLSESTDMDAYPPIIIDKDDDYLINGRIIAVVKGST